MKIQTTATTMTTTMTTTVLLLLSFVLFSHGFVSSRFGVLPSMSTSSTTERPMIMDFLNQGKKALVKAVAGDFDETSTRALLDSYIATPGVMMLSFTTCPFCIKAKELLDGKGATYKVVELNVIPEGKAIRVVMADVIGRTSVPAVFIDGVFVGGCNDGPTEEFNGLVKLDQAGKLDALLAAAGAL
jgi:glutaredoxin 3